MKATKDHISLETAKLLKDCGVESKYEWGCDGHHFCGEEEYEENNYRVEEKWFFSRFPEKPLGPAYTWQEILWEYAEEFFGGEYIETYYYEEKYDFCVSMYYYAD